MTLSRKFTWLWIAWLIAFTVIEIWAWRSPASGDTLSEHAWFIVSSPVGAVVLAVGLGLLAYHFLKEANWP